MRRQAPHPAKAQIKPVAVFGQATVKIDPHRERGASSGVIPERLVDERPHVTFVGGIQAAEAGEQVEDLTVGSASVVNRGGHDLLVTQLVGERPDESLIRRGRLTRTPPWESGPVIGPCVPHRVHTVEGFLEAAPFCVARQHDGKPLRVLHRHGYNSPTYRRSVRRGSGRKLAQEALDPDQCLLEFR